MFSKFGKLGAIIGFIIGNAVWVYYINASTEIIIPIGEIVVASVILFFLPKRISDFIDTILDIDNCLDGNEPRGLLSESTIFKLDAVSEVAKEMAENIENTEDVEDNKIGRFIKTLNENACVNCSCFSNCWKQNYHSMYETVFNCLEILTSKNKISEEDITGSICENKTILVQGLNFSYEMFKVNKECQSKINEDRKLIAAQLRGISEAINVVKKDQEVLASNNLLGAGFKLEVGVSTNKKAGSKLSGDTNILEKLRNGRILVGLSDGMGSGEKASKSSKKVLELLKKYLNAGLSKKIALELINSYMMIGENKDTYATLDVIEFNPNDASIKLIKYGACPTYIKKGEKINIISSNSLPIGTVMKQDNDFYKDTLNRGDYIIIISDGILEVKPDKELWIKELLMKISSDKPKRIADIILQEAIDSNFGINNDDMTVVVAKVC